MEPTIEEMREVLPGYYNVRFGEPEYTDWIDESKSWKEACYIGDWSFLWQRWFRGPDALKLFSDISVNSFSKFDIGQSKHVIHCNKDGMVIHEGILSRFGEEEFLLFGRGCFWADYKLRHGNYNATSQEDDWFVYQVSGPKSVAVMEKAMGDSIRDVGFMRFKKIKLAGKEIYALRQGMAGEIGFELQGPRELGPEIYAAILAAGEEFGIRRMGARVASINHLEACFPTIVMDYLPAMFEPDMTEYREEFEAAMPGFAQTVKVGGSFDGTKPSDYYRSPVELGWTKNIKFDHDFIGREALEKEVANPKRTIRTLVWNEEDVLDVHASLYRDEDPYPFMDMPRDQRRMMGADKVLKDGKVVGVSTSRGYSYHFREMISLCVIDTDMSEVGTEVVVVWGAPGGPQKEIRAQVAPAPYKPDNRRASLSSLS
ncbi:glycine cleavage T C-terminal barrel domain-containing protein [Neorhizobium tomejilense]|uniref:glycine cleavage T C-terminal barrel domain-containing protein n=1 Tax=Neorhizobium tomejilense TaxID=2093828 RepID=UPI001FDFD7CA|nr:glycine cleavage T C-terminal barrel domain-containing protein [Neorhizobium tomejilense]